MTQKTFKMEKNWTDFVCFLSMRLTTVKPDPCYICKNFKKMEAVLIGPASTPV